MARLLSRPARRDRSLVKRFQRAVNAGSVVMALVGVAVFTVIEIGADRIDDHAHDSHLLATQRIALLELRSTVQELVDARDPAAAAGLRVELAGCVDAVDENHTALTIARPDVGRIEVVVADERVPLGVAVRDLLDRIDRVVDVHATSPADSPVLAGYVATTLERIDTVAAPLAVLDEGDGGALADDIAWLRLAGRVLAALAIVGSVVRALLLGRPLVQTLGREQEQVQAAEVQHRHERARRDLNARLAEGLESAEDETGVRAVVERAFASVIDGHPAEMRLADSSKAHLALTAANPGVETPGCGVASPWSCPAVRRGGTIVYDDSDGIRACPYLADRPGGRCSAVCVPVSFMGDAMGVVHVTGTVGWNPPAQQIESLELIASQTAMRLGQIRSMQKARLQASTDVLTGLPNRRATEEYLRTALTGRGPAAVAMADLDHFKQLNDSYGHEAGDRALRMFAEVLRESVRDGDWVARWGGEEFVLFFPDLMAHEVGEVLDRLRTNLARRCAFDDRPSFTVSIGVVDVDHALTLDQTIAHADACLYRAKEAGRDRIVVGDRAAITAGAGSPEEAP